MKSNTKLALMAMVLAVALVTEPMATNGFTFTLCGVSLDGLKTCKPAVSVVKGSTAPLPLPTKECCDAIAGADVPCLCKYKDSSFLSDNGIDPKLAMKLPELCKMPQAASFHC